MTTVTKNYPHADTTWFTHDRFGMFIHWGLYALPARHEWVQHTERLSTEEYQKYFDHFDPDLYDPAAWARTAAEAGMKYAVITTKHHEGFCLWDSNYTDFKATATPYGRDLIKPFVEAFHNEGLKVGFYYSLIDWHHPDFPVDRIHPQRDDSSFRLQEQNRDVSKYTRYLHNQIKELLSTYPVDILWCDFSYPGEDGKGRDDWQSEKLVKLIRKLRPDIILNDRLDLPGSADVVTPEQYVPAGGLTDPNGNPVVWEGCQTFSGSWGYHRDESSWKSVPMLIEMLIDHVSKGGNLLLNVGPTARGTIDDRAGERLAAIGTWMRAHARSIYGCTAAPSECIAPPDCRYTWNPETNRLYLHLFTWPFGAVHLPALAGKVAYAQMLNDASEITMRHISHDATLARTCGDDCLTLVLPVQKPAVEVPVIELFLKHE